MIKKEKKVVNLAEEVTPIQTDKSKPTLDQIPSDTKSETKVAPKKVSKKTKVEKEEKKANKKLSATSKEPKDTKKTTKLHNKVEKIETIEQVYFQYAGNELSTGAILEQVKQLWVASGHKLSALQTLNLYIKPEENTAYYVINSIEMGKVDL